MRCVSISVRAPSIRDVHGIIWNSGDVPGISHDPLLTPSSQPRGSDSVWSLSRKHTHTQTNKVISALACHNACPLKGTVMDGLKQRNRGTLVSTEFWKTKHLSSFFHFISGSSSKDWSFFLISRLGSPARHISFSLVACWEEMTLLTVNYSQPSSPLFDAVASLFLIAHVWSLLLCCCCCRRLLLRGFSISSTSEGSSIGIRVKRWVHCWWDLWLKGDLCIIWLKRVVWIAFTHYFKGGLTLKWHHLCHLGRASG